MTVAAEERPDRRRRPPRERGASLVASDARPWLFTQIRLRTETWAELHV
jgi:hypothetical protein